MQKSAFSTSSLAILSVLGPMLLASAGCGDDYDAAMKRLAAERTHYDWIESKIRQIDADRDKEDRDLESKMDELTDSITSGATPSQQATERHEKMMALYARLREQNVTIVDPREKDWRLKLVEQRNRAQQARNAADEAL